MSLQEQRHYAVNVSSDGCEEDEAGNKGV